MAAIELDSARFKILADGIGRDSVTKCSHRVYRGVLSDGETVFFRKEMKNSHEARAEALAQEFFRLIIPTQPKTYIARDPVHGIYYILSEEVPGYRDLPYREQERFTRGDYFGLGQVLVGAIFLQEVDLKNGNVGLNSTGQVVKIDGDWCFASFVYSKRYSDKFKAITSQLIESLPYPQDLFAHNWLDMRVEERLATDRALLDSNALSKAPHFKAEINQAILRILLLPNSYLQKFVDAFMPSMRRANLYIQFLKERREQLKTSALQIESFRAYLASESACDDVRQFLIHMKQFTVNGYYSVVDEPDQHALETQFKLLKDELDLLRLDSDVGMIKSEGNRGQDRFTLFSTRGEPPIAPTLQLDAVKKSSEAPSETQRPFFSLQRVGTVHSQSVVYDKAQELGEEIRGKGTTL